MRAVLWAVLTILVAGCAGPGGDPGPLPVADEALHEEWFNWTQEGSFIGYSVPPVMAGTVPDEGEPVRDVFVAPGTTFLRLVFSPTPPDDAEYYVAEPSCPESNVADCRDEAGFVDDEFLVWETVQPEPGQWRFEVAGSGGGVQRVQWTMQVSCSVDLALVAPDFVSTCGSEPPRP